MRPDCSRPQPRNQKKECNQDVRKSGRRNFAALQKTGLMFIYMASPDIKAKPAANKVIKDKVEGSFTVKFSVAADGTVYDVQTRRSPKAYRPSRVLGGNHRPVDICKDQQARHRIEYLSRSTCTREG